ncbi:MAG: biotin--[acetyl-CoA-carboxylase] ligase [Candidatus Omnitrophica bacterium]|nr:biotin--[acetyl-CoA-carboxylase] ligase [Candidatus Omnitrophota bacterium]
MDEKILALMRDREEYISGEEISRELGISRAAIWKHIDKLRREGYDIASAPHYGYKIVSAPDRLIREEVSWGLKTRRFGKKIYSFKKTDSTNTLAYKLAENGETEGAVVFAEEQAMGRGRMERKWQSPAGGIYMSLILKPRIEPVNTARITLAAAVAVNEAVRDITGLNARIKWPNDILVNSKKVSGILTEMKAEQDEIDFVILGIGINVNNPKKDLPGGATSLKDELGQAVSKVNLAKRVLELLESYHEKATGDFSGVIDEWRKLSDTLSKRVRIRMHGETLEGHALDVDENGGLILRLDSGFNKHILSGDVELVR